VKNQLGLFDVVVPIHGGPGTPPGTRPSDKEESDDHHHAVSDPRPPDDPKILRELSRPGAGPAPEGYDQPVDLDPVDPQLLSELKKLVDVVWEETHDFGAFRRCCDIWWAVLDRYTPGAEERYLEGVKDLSSRAVEAMTEGFALLMQHFCVDGKYDDVLGKLYMDIASDWGKRALGQFFTPWPICLCMAQFLIGDLDIDRFLDGPAFTVNEPALGSGAMLLAMRAVVADKFGRWYTRGLHVTGQDIDHLCVTMARIQLAFTDDARMVSFLIASHDDCQDMIDNIEVTV